MIYTWVDGALPGHLAARQSYADKSLDMNPERYRDPFQNMRYSLRSVHEYLPWINKIYIVTDRPQIPAWLNLDHPQIKIIHHDEFIPHDYLPTFSSNTIESFLHLIPGLGDHFIYMCDDFFFLKQTDISHFWADERYAVFGSLIGENLKWRVYDQKNNIIGTGFVEHGPHFAKKSYWKAMTEMRPAEMEATRRRKFRHPENLVTFKLYRSYMLAHQRAVSRPVMFWNYMRFSVFLKLVNDNNIVAKGFEKLRSKRPNFYCLNDDLRGNPDPDVVAMVKNFLTETYPNPSPFEIAGGS